MKHAQHFLLWLLVCVGTSCDKRQTDTTGKSSSTQVVSLTNGAHRVRQDIAASGASGRPSNLVTAADEGSVAASVSSIIISLSGTAAGAYLTGEDVSFLEQDWRTISSPQERSVWASRAMGTPGGVEKARDAFASLTNSPDVYWRTRAFCALAIIAGREGDFWSVQSLLAECEQQLVSDTHMPIERLDCQTLLQLDQVWEMRAALARTIHDSRYKGQHDEGLDARPESFWQELRLRYFPYENNRKAMICADLAFALMQEGKRDDARRRLGEALDMLANERNKNAASQGMLREYQKLLDDWKAGRESSVSKTYW